MQLYVAVNRINLLCQYRSSKVERTQHMNMAVFSKLLTPTDVGHTLQWPADWLSFLPQFTHQFSFEAVDSDDNVRWFTCSVRQHGRYRKPVLTGQTWTPFVRDKGLAANDLLLLYHEPGQPIQIRVRKRKTIRLFGQNITGYAVEE